MFLSEDDLKSLTGYVRPAEQVRWLRANGVSFKLDRWRRPRVLTSEIERALSADTNSVADEPNWDAMRKAG